MEIEYDCGRVPEWEKQTQPDDIVRSTIEATIFCEQLQRQYPDYIFRVVADGEEITVKLVLPSDHPYIEQTYRSVVLNGPRQWDNIAIRKLVKNHIIYLFHYLDKNRDIKLTIPLHHTELEEEELEAIVE